MTRSTDPILPPAERRDSYVYAFVTENFEFVKIGKSNGPDKRLQDLVVSQFEIQ